MQVQKPSAVSVNDVSITPAAHRNSHPNDLSGKYSSILDKYKGSPSRLKNICVVMANYTHNTFLFGFQSQFYWNENLKLLQITWSHFCRNFKRLLQMSTASNFQEKLKHRTNLKQWSWLLKVKARKLIRYVAPHIGMYRSWQQQMINDAELFPMPVVNSWPPHEWLPPCCVWSTLLAGNLA